MNSKKEGMPMQSEKRTGYVPKLRFPEFLGEAEWKFVPLNKLAKRCTQKNRSGAITRVLTNSAEHGVVDQRDYFDKDIATQGNLESYYVVKKGDYVYNPRISTRAPVGPISKNNVATGVMSPLYSVFRFDDSNNDFYAYYFKTTGWHQYMRQASSTGARHDRMAITNDDFMAMPLPVSTPKEQQKIADCLATLDECLGLASKNLSELRAHKKGLMQQLFPAEGETVPTLRFPEFLDAGEWDVTHLSELIASLDAGVSINSGDRPAMSDEFGVLKTSAVTNGVFEPQENKVVSDAAELGRAKELVQGDTIIISRMNTPALVGANAYVETDLDNIFLPDRLWAAKPKPGTSMRFIACILGSAKGRAALSKLAKGSSGSMKNITKAEVLSLSIMVPSPTEQQRIADCLGGLDALITAATLKFEALKRHRRGLMQQLFPSTTEVHE
ncbi:restriction endonuclease subunit S [Pantoea dispersa]|uniref:restriction endonuclease subunit S n=1 Tax=Pantoea dispersa TaxID=59814 RepID=UPI003212F05E